MLFAMPSSQRHGWQLCMGPRKEAPALIVGTQSRPADVFLPTWSRGRPAALDVTVTSPLQALTIQEASTTLLVMHLRSPPLGNWPLICHLAGQQDWTSSLWQWRLWVGGSEMPLIPSMPLVGNRARDSGHPLEVGISSRGSPSPCGGEMPISG